MDSELEQRTAATTGDDALLTAATEDGRRLCDVGEWCRSWCVACKCREKQAEEPKLELVDVRVLDMAPSATDGETTTRNGDCPEQGEAERGGFSAAVCSPRGCRRRGSGRRRPDGEEEDAADVKRK